MEQRVDELSSHLEEAGEFVLHSAIDVVVLVGSYFEILFKLGER